jgi:serine/threonine protein phosphatase 1
MRRFGIGDIHGRFVEFKALLKAVNFDYDEDELISLGDLVDYGQFSFEVIFELLKIKKLISIKGNHDEYLRDYIEDISRGHPLNGQAGSRITMMQWAQLLSTDREIIKDFLNNKQKLYHIDDKNNLYVHAGIDTDFKIEDQMMGTLIEDRFFFERKLMSMQRSQKEKIKTIENFNEIFIGHTPTLVYKKDKNGIYKEEPGWSGVEVEPIHICNVLNIDTGAKISKIGRLTLINLDTHEFIQQEIA